MKTKKIIILVIALITFIMIGTTISNATINPNDFIPTIGPEDAGDAIGIAQKIISAINIVGTIISVVVIIALGIKYMAGSIEERAEYKKTMVPILIGAILLFGTSWILKIIYDIVPN